MTAAEVYRTALRLGATLQAVDGRIEVDAPEGAAMDSLILEITAGRPELLRLLRNPDQLCRQLWAQALEEISSFWALKTCLLSDGQKDDWWLDEALDLELQGAVRTAILAGDPAMTFQACERWQESWRKCLCEEKKFSKLAPPAPPAPPASPIGAQDNNVPRLTDSSEPGQVVARSVEQSISTLPFSSQAHTTREDSTFAPSLF